MKANNGKGNIPLRDMWQTPQDLWDQLDKQYNFIYDCCADENNTKCNLFSSNFETEYIFIKGVAWMNPPFSIAWRMFEHFFKIVTKGVAIYRCDNFETGLWQKVIFSHADWIFIPNKRISYDGLDGDGARFPSALIGIGVKPPKDIKGILLRIGRGYDKG